MKLKNIIETLYLMIFLVISSVRMIDAQEIATPLEVQYPIFLKILTFDRNFTNKIKDIITIGIIYQTKYKTSENVKDRFIEISSKSKIKTFENIPIRCVSIDIDKINLSNAIMSNKINILYVTPLRAFSITDICDISRRNKIITLSGVPKYIDSGIAVSIDIKNQKPQIVINVSAAKAEGADFSSQLLKLAKIVR